MPPSYRGIVTNFQSNGADYIFVNTIKYDSTIHNADFYICELQQYNKLLLNISTNS